MDIETWMLIYKEILSDFGYDEHKDRISCSYLSENICKVDLSGLLDRFRSSVITVVGNADNLQKEISCVTGTVICAGSSISRYIEMRGLPDIIVTDLDHGIDPFIESLKNGKVGVIHAHGDNLDMIREFPFSNSYHIIGTCQCVPYPNTMNFGGFTDGDRAVILADYLDSPRINIVGFDFDHPAKGSSPLKARKLKWAKRIIAMVYESRLEKYGKDNIIQGGKTFRP